MTKTQSFLAHLGLVLLLLVYLVATALIDQQIREIQEDITKAEAALELARIEQRETQVLFDKYMSEPWPIEVFQKSAPWEDLTW